MPDGIEGLAESLPGGKNKIAGKSVYIYGAVIGAVVVIYLWWSGRGESGGSATDFEDTATPSVSGDLGDLPRAANVTDLTDETTSTNSYWEAKAVAWLATQGVSPLAAQQAIEKYFGGEQLDYNQSLIVDKAIREFGPPPESLLSAPLPTTTPPNSSNAIKWTNKVTRYAAVGTVTRYSGPSTTSKKRGTVPGGHVITAIQEGSVNGQVWVRTLNGVYFRKEDLTIAPKAAPKKEAVKK